jgi:hypothetical protein
VHPKVTQTQSRKLYIYAKYIVLFFEIIHDHSVLKKGQRPFR